MIDPLRTPIEPRQPVALGLMRGDRMIWIHAQVMARPDPDVIWIVVPNEQALPPGMGVGAELDLYASRDMDARYMLRVKVISRRPDGLLTLRLSSGRRIQDRQYFRVPVTIAPDEAVKEVSGGSEQPLRLQVRDLSASGMRARSQEPVGIGDLIRVKLRLPGDAKPIELRARVVRPIDRPWPAEYACEFGATFLEPPPDVTERLIHYTLQEQRELRRKGLL
jgi:hypothetical protein